MRAQARLQELYRQLDLDEKARFETYDVVQGKNDWLKDFKGMTYTDKLHRALTRGIFEEHAKFSDGSVSNIEKAMVYCLEPRTKEIISLGGSSLLKGRKTGRIIPDLIVNNFGLWLSGLFAPSTTTNISVNLTDSGGLVKALQTYSSGDAFSLCGASYPVGTLIKMGSSSLAPQRSDYKINTSLGSSPESNAIFTNLGSYTSSNTIVCQADANPTGGSGAVNEIGLHGQWFISTPATDDFLIAHDSITPTVNYTAGFLLRGAYTWQI